MTCKLSGFTDLGETPTASGESTSYKRKVGVAREILAQHKKPEIVTSKTKAGKLRVAVIGTGYFSQFHYRAWQRMPQAELVALHAQDPLAGRDTQARYGIEHLYTDVDAMLGSGLVDLVDIVTPPPSHARILQQCIDHSIPAICQKPFCLDIAEARDMVSRITNANAFVAVHENFRFQPWYQCIRSYITEGLPGPLYEIRFDLRPGDGQGPDAYLGRQPYFREQDRFLVQETGVHFVDVFRYLFGEINGLYARLDRLNPVIAGEDCALVLFDFANGARGLFDGNRLVDHASANPRLTMGEMRIEGAEGTITLDGFGTVLFRRNGSANARKLDYQWQDIDFGGDCVYNTNLHVLNHLLTGSPLHNSARDYLVNREIEDTIYRSASEQRWLPC